MHRKQVDERRRRINPVGTAGAHGRAEMLCQAQQAEVPDIHFVTRDGQAMAVHDAADARMFGCIDEDIDTMRDLPGHVRHGLAVGDIEGNYLHVRDSAQGCLARKGLPGICDTNKDDRCTGHRYRSDYCLSDFVASIRHQHPAELRIAGQFPQLHVILLVFGWMVRHGQRDGVAALVQAQSHPHPSALSDITVQMRNKRRAAVQSDGADTPGRTLPKIDIGAGPDRRLCQHSSAWRHILERHASGQTTRTGISWRVQGEAAIGANLQSETTLGRRRRKPMSGAAAHALRQEWLSRFLQRVLAARACQRFGHARANSTAELASPRS